MSRVLSLSIVTPDRLVLQQNVDSVTCTGLAGEFTILPLHIPFLSSLAVGFLSYRQGGVQQTVFVSGGFADVAFDRVLILAEAAELPEEIDVDRARKARDRAQTRMEVQRQEDLDYTRAKTALQRAILRIKLHELAGNGLGHRAGKE